MLIEMHVTDKELNKIQSMYPRKHISVKEGPIFITRREARMKKELKHLGKEPITITQLYRLLKTNDVIISWKTIQNDINILAERKIIKAAVVPYGKGKTTLISLP